MLIYLITSINGFSNLFLQKVILPVWLIFYRNYFCCGKINFAKDISL